MTSARTEIVVDRRPTPDVSVVVPTYNRSAQLAVALDALLAQRSNDIAFEVIVVDNGSSEPVREIVEARIRRDGPRVQYVLEERPGVAYARNTGIARSCGRIVGFSDDDEFVAPDWIFRIKRLFELYPDADFIAGRVLPVGTWRAPSWLTDWNWGTLGLMDRGDRPFRVDRHRRGYGWLSSGNLAVRREVLVALDGFDPSLQRVRDGIGSIEDHDLVMRICLSGGHGHYRPDLVAFAEVPANRLEKRYHRRWQSGNGRFCARIRFFDTDPDALMLFGVPGSFYRDFAREAGSYVAATVCRNQDAAFQHELRLRWGWNFVRASHANHARGRTWREIGSVSAELISRRCRSLLARARPAQRNR